MIRLPNNCFIFCAMFLENEKLLDIQLLSKQFYMKVVPIVMWRLKKFPLISGLEEINGLSRTGIV